MPEQASTDVEVVVPVLDERDSVAEFHARVERAGYASGLIFVDNASTDGTPEFLERLPGTKVIHHAANLGYGASIRDGLAATSAAKVVIIDADLEYPPEAIPGLVAALDDHAAVYGSRFLSASPPRMPRVRRFGNGLVSTAFNYLFHQDTTDLYTGVKALRREAIDSLRLTRNGFEHVVEMGIQLARAGFRIRDVPVDYFPRSRGISKMRHVPELMKCLGLIVRYRFAAEKTGRPAPEAR